jgi:serine/threonine protein phosphatase PrpC
VAAEFPPLKASKTRGAAATETGPYRQVNEDACAYFEDEMASIAVVADGCGGNSSGSPASRMTVETTKTLFDARNTTIIDDVAEEWWKAEHESSRDVAAAAAGRARPYDALPIADRAAVRERVTALLKKRVPDAIGDVAALEGEKKVMLELPRRVIVRSNEAIQRAVLRDRNLRGMGAAVMIGMFAAGEVSIAHVGDCRAYRVRGGAIETITEEHTLAREYRNAPDFDPAQLQYIEEQHASVITRAVGTNPDVLSDFFVEPAIAGDSYVLTTDGLWQLFSPEEIKEAVLKFGIGAAAYLIRLGSREMPNHPGDNLSAVVVQIL